MSIHCYSPTTVSRHKKNNDAWITIHGNVFDVTNFITMVSDNIVFIIIINIFYLFINNVFLSLKIKYN